MANYKAQDKTMSSSKLEKKKLIIIGASYLQMPLINKAKEMGIETHVFAWEEGAVGKAIADFFYPISITEKRKILNVAKNIQPDGVVTIASDLAVVTVNYIASKLGLTGNPIESTNATTNKFEMRTILSKNNIPCPTFLETDGTNECDTEQFRFPLIVKPTDRSGSRGVTKVLSPQDLQSSISRAIDSSLEKKAIIEDFIEGREISVEMISWEGKHHFLACTDKQTTGAPYFVETAHHQPAQLSPKLQQKIIEVVNASLTALNIQFGASHSELLITDNLELFVVEIGARMGGDFIGSDLVRLSTGYDFVKGTIDVALNQFTPPQFGKNAYSGVYFLFPPQYGKISEITEQATTEHLEVQKEIQTTPGSIVSPPKESGQRLGYYIYQSTNKKLKNNPLKICIE